MAPKAKKAASASSGGPPSSQGTGGGVKKKVTKVHHESYERYIFNVLKQIHPKLGISRQAMSIMQSCVQDTFERVATEAGRLCRMGGKDTMSIREVQSAVRLTLPGEIAKHAVNEATKAVDNYKKAQDKTGSKGEDV
eukprot:TRINITY_DN117273_c0_g1_i1.p1 TRINITY_DN117273_c0_g1~~TRINITY_DN117273_c0_g1_i1.p1  ORF type:complete len:137 (-),score=47.14 TRINITY_DN117273_c0_g1_i1:53-463(-)